MRKQEEHYYEVWRRDGKKPCSVRLTTSFAEIERRIASRTDKEIIRILLARSASPEHDRKLVAFGAQRV